MQPLLIEVYSIFELDIPFCLINTFFYFVHFLHMSSFWFLALVVILDRLNVIASSHSSVFYQIFLIFLSFFLSVSSVEILSAYPVLARRTLSLFFNQFAWVWVPSIIIRFWVFTYIFLDILHRLKFHLHLLIKNFLLLLFKLFIPLLFLVPPNCLSFSSWSLYCPNFICCHIIQNCNHFIIDFDSVSIDLLANHC